MTTLRAGFAVAMLVCCIGIAGAAEKKAVKPTAKPAASPPEQPAEEEVKTRQFTGIITYFDDKRLTLQNLNGDSMSFRVHSKMDFGKKKAADFKVTVKTTVTYIVDADGHRSAQSLRTAR